MTLCRTCCRRNERRWPQASRYSGEQPLPSSPRRRGPILRAREVSGYGFPPEPAPDLIGGGNDTKRTNITRLKFRVQAAGEDVNRSAIGVVRGILQKLIIEGERDVLRQPERVIGFQDSFPMIV